GLGDGPSINKDGTVAFIARSPNPGTPTSNAVFTVDAAGVCKAINPNSSSGILAFGDAVQINDSGRIATSDRGTLPGPFTSHIRNWDSRQVDQNTIVGYGSANPPVDPVNGQPF